jgi:hypothetical protein
LRVQKLCLKEGQAVSEKSITRQQARLIGRAKNESSEAATPLGPALVTNSLCPGWERRTVCTPEGQIGNSSLGCSQAAICLDDAPGFVLNKNAGWIRRGRTRT